MFRIWNWCRFLSLCEKVGNGRYIFSRLEFYRIGIPKFHAKISIELVNMVSATEHWLFFTWIPSFFLLWILLSKNLIRWNPLLFHISLTEVNLTWNLSGIIWQYFDLLFTLSYMLSELHLWMKNLCQITLLRFWYFVNEPPRDFFFTPWYILPRW